MKKFIKSCLVVVLMVCVCFGFTACKDKLSATTTDVSKVKIVNDKTTNGGITVVHDDYLYFINGTKDNDGTSLTGNKRSAICRIKYDVETGKTTGNAEVVVSNLVGFNNGSIYFFGNFMYFSTPCEDVNYKGDVLYNKTSFVRYDLVNKKTQTLYTTALNNAEDKINFAYYVVDEKLNLLVYESTNKTLKSMKIGDEVSTNYVIKNVESCLFSETFGNVEMTGATVDANSYVFYTKSPSAYDYPQTGVQVYKVSAIKNNSKMISEGTDVTLVTIRSGRLIYSKGEEVYAEKITSGNDTLKFENCLSFENYDNLIFIDNYKIDGEDEGAKLVSSEGDETFLYFDADNHYFVMLNWQNGQTLKHEILSQIDSATSFEFIGLTKLEEVVVEDDPLTEGVDETETREALYVVYKNASLVYKIEVAEVVDENTLTISHYAQPIKLSATEVNDSNGLIVPEIIGNFVFVMANDDDKKPYMYIIDLTPTETVTKKAETIRVKD